MYTREEETTEESEHKLEIGLKGKWHNPFLLFSVSVPHTGPTHGCVCLFVCLSQRKDKQKDERSSSFHSFPLTLTYPKRNLQQRQQRRGRKEEPFGVHRVSLVPGLKRITPSLSWSLPYFSTSFFLCACLL